MISIRHIVKTFAGVHAVDDCTFDVREGTITGLIGPDGAGNNVPHFRVEAFVIGSMFMGPGGALYAHFTGLISPRAFDPMFATFVVWVMLIAGGSDNNRGALLGALVIWGVWTLAESSTGMLPDEFVTRASAFRIFLIGLLLEIILLTRPQGMLPEKPPKPFDRR